MSEELIVLDHKFALTVSTPVTLTTIYKISQTCGDYDMIDTVNRQVKVISRSVGDIWDATPCDVKGRSNSLGRYIRFIRQGSHKAHVLTRETFDREIVGEDTSHPLHSQFRLPDELARQRHVVMSRVRALLAENPHTSGIVRL